MVRVCKPYSLACLQDLLSFLPDVPSYSALLLYQYRLLLPGHLIPYGIVSTFQYLSKWYKDMNSGFGVAAEISIILSNFVPIISSRP